MAKRKQSKNRKQVKRQTRHFQLRTEHPIDQHVKEILDYKRAQRSEVTAIRDGVRLLWALENGDLDVLFTMFPQYRNRFVSPGGSGGDSSDTARIAAMLELFMAEQKQNSGYLMKSALPAPKITPAAPPPIAEVKQAASVSADSIADNFLAAFL